MDNTILLTLPQTILACAVTMGVPSAFTAYIFRKYEKREEEKERKKDDYQMLILENINAALALGEATARAVQRIPDAKCNGDMSQALVYAQDVKHKQKNFIRKQAIENLRD